MRSAILLGSCRPGAVLSPIASDVHCTPLEPRHLLAFDVGVVQMVANDPYPTDFGMIKTVSVTVWWKNFSPDPYYGGINGNGYVHGSIVVSRDTILGNGDDDVMNDDNGVAPSLAGNETKTTSFTLHYIAMPDPGFYYLGMITDNRTTSGQGPIRKFLSADVGFISLSQTPLPGGVATGTSGKDVIVVQEGGDRNLVYVNSVPYGLDQDEPIRIDGGAGNDRILVDVDFSYPVEINGGDGDDYIVCGRRNDSVLGGAGKDTIYGSYGNDTLNGNAQADSLYGEEGNDRLVAHGGNDKLYGGAGEDRLYGGDGNDRLDGGAHKDRLWSENGNDTLSGGSGTAIDRLFGGVGDDRFDGGLGADILKGEGGYDLAKQDSNDERTSIDGWWI